MAEPNNVLAIAVAYGRVGYVYLKGSELRDWGISRKASQSPKLARKQTTVWIDRLKPDVVVTEKLSKRSRKSKRTRGLIEAVALVASNEYLLDIAVSRVKTFKNKYAEAKALAKRFPELTAWVPKERKIWDKEPVNTIYFEALALALNEKKNGMVK